MGWPSPMFNSILWKTTALILSTVAGGWNLVVIRAGLQEDRVAHAMPGSKGREG